MTRAMEKNVKNQKEADSKDQEVKTFGAYLPQSLSDNILVSHKSQALQCHSKKRTRGKATDTQRKGKKSEHDTRTTTHRLARFHVRTTNRTNTHTEVAQASL